MVVFTDGWSNKGPDPAAMAKEAVAKGFEVYSVSYTVSCSKVRICWVLAASASRFIIEGHLDSVTVTYD